MGTLFARHPPPPPPRTRDDAVRALTELIERYRNQPVPGRNGFYYPADDAVACRQYTGGVLTSEDEHRCLDAVLRRPYVMTALAAALDGRGELCPVCNVATTISW